MAIALWSLGFVLLFIWGGRCSWRYWVATRKSLRKDTVASPMELLTTLPDENAAAYLHWQADPAMESLRRRVWLVYFLLDDYARVREWLAEGERTDCRVQDSVYEQFRRFQRNLEIRMTSSSATEIDP